MVKNRKKNKLVTLMTAVLFSVSVLSACGAKTKAENPGEPPAEVLNGDRATQRADAGQQQTQTGRSTAAAEADSKSGYEGDLLENAISVRIGREGVANWDVDMYNNNAALTMLDYLSSSALLFPTYTYDEEGGFVAQVVRGDYTRDDEQTVADVKCGELYLFSGGQLRFYFEDVEGADITATPIGYFADTQGLTDAVQEAHTANLDDTWGVEVYFLITKTLE